MDQFIKKTWHVLTKRSAKTVVEGVCRGLLLRLRGPNAKIISLHTHIQVCCTIFYTMFWQLYFSWWSSGALVAAQNLRQKWDRIVFQFEYNEGWQFHNGLWWKIDDELLRVGVSRCLHSRRKRHSWTCYLENEASWSLYQRNSTEFELYELAGLPYASTKGISKVHWWGNQKRWSSWWSKVWWTFYQICKDLHLKHL